MKKEKSRVQQRPKRRGPKQPLPLPHRSSDHSDNSIYTYAVLNSGSEYDNYGSKLSANGRCYIDPWDLENYDYVRKKLSSPSIDGSSGNNNSPSPAGEPILSSQFLYLPNNNKDECPGCYAEMNEETFYNKKYESIYDDEHEFTMYSDFESPYSTERNNSSCEEENITSSSLMLHSPGFKAPYSRKMVLPKPDPSKILEFPKPPPYFDYSKSYLPCCDTNGYCSLTSCYDCTSEAAIERDLYATRNIYSTKRDIYIPPIEEIYGPAADASIYGYVGTGGTSIYARSSGSSSLYSTLNRFALSKKGLLQIDYSCNWNDLDRYIAKEF